MQIEKETLNTDGKLTISYRMAHTRFGPAVLASTSQGLCYLALIDEEQEGLETLKSRFRKADFRKEETVFHQKALTFLESPRSSQETVPLHLMGTDFQLAVWGALLEIPFGKCVTYGDIANRVGNPKASRAIGTAIGNNPVAYIVPCHRVIRADGALGGYRWGIEKKKLILAYEQ